MRVGKKLAVTNHAIERLEKRMKITGKEIFVVVRKAWFSRQPICEEFWKSKYNLKNIGCTTYHYRKYKGHIFCFQKKYVDVVLMTVFPEEPEHYEANTKKTFTRTNIVMEKEVFKRKNNPIAKKKHMLYNTEKQIKKPYAEKRKNNKMQNLRKNFLYFDEQIWD